MNESHDIGGKAAGVSCRSAQPRSKAWAAGSQPCSGSEAKMNDDANESHAGFIRAGDSVAHFIRSNHLSRLARSPRRGHRADGARKLGPPFVMVMSEVCFIPASASHADGIRALDPGRGA